MDELKTELGKIDPSIEVEVGNYRMDAKGNTITKKVSLYLSIYSKDLTSILLFEGT